MPAPQFFLSQEHMQVFGAANNGTVKQNGWVYRKNEKNRYVPCVDPMGNITDDEGTPTDPEAAEAAQQAEAKSLAEINKLPDPKTLSSGEFDTLINTQSYDVLQRYAAVHFPQTVNRNLPFEALVSDLIAGWQHMMMEQGVQAGKSPDAEAIKAREDAAEKVVQDAQTAKAAAEAEVAKMKEEMAAMQEQMAKPVEPEKPAAKKGK